MSFTTHYNRNAFGEHGNANQIWLKGSSGKEWHYGISIAQSSNGNERVWTTHAPGTQDPHFTSFRLAGPGLKNLPGKLEWDTPGAPKLEVWEERPGVFRWEVKDAWQVQCLVSSNEGETWTPLGAGNQGKATLSLPPGSESVVRFQAYKGLRGFVDVFQPGKGFMADPSPYQKPTYFEARGGLEQGNMSNYPAFRFSPDVVLAREYVGRAKVRVNWQKLPFDLAKVLPDRFVHFIFQADWQNYDAKEVFCVFQFGDSLLRDPKREQHIRLYRVKRQEEGDGKSGTWKADLMSAMEKSENPHYPVFSGYVVDGCAWEKGRVHGGGNYKIKTDMNMYWVVTSD
jgi:hypothetical protein